MKPSGWKVLRFLKPYWLWIVLAPLLMLLEVVMDLMQPRMVERIVDQGIANLDLPFVLQTGLLMFGLAVIGATGGMSNGIFAEMTVQGFGADLREALFRKVQSFSFRNLDAFETGQLITRLTSDVAQLQEGVLITLRMLVRAPLLLIGSLVMAIVTSPQLAFLPLVLMPIELLAVVWIVRKATPLFTLVQEKLDALNGVMEENLSGMRVVKAFARAAHEKQRFAHANRALTDQAVRAGRTVAVMPSFMMLTMNLGIVGVLWFGGVQVVRGGMQVGQIIAFVNYLMTTLFSLMMVSQMVIQFSRAEASARRIEEVLETEPELQDAPNAICDVRLKGHIVFDRVTFRYDGADSEPVLKEVSFTAQPGETVALLGMTGAGKSTLVHLIPRFYDVQGGRILIDGMDVREIDQKTLRRNIGMVLQETVLFSGTIRDNIRYGKPDASEEEVIAAAKAAQAHDFILTLPEGYDTVIGQRGVNLSGGQKQRLAIARALLIQPAILILDDSTSAVDVETETRIQQALEDLMRNRTCLVIAQRISTVLKADKILVLDDGRIVAQGTHAELLANSPIYQDIFESQLGNGVKIYG
ncbi:ABC transporter ATP-binding protein [Anaerolinea thermophila]|uniref:ABC transporter n=1 Tax=Anaerolinea thermophila (strain DSM 14523 / JCM 11388 / NBRC 100420 / UNI-1) TaxID=926569 RepID=E8MZ41_ANATU|nr:ABC transporter ATP-binding protein [Anaerolinea thermophila]BAJ62184.1 putative ABC transporter [Anaerolinea thermophila UNI-1]